MDFIERLQYYMDHIHINDNQLTLLAGLSNGLIGKAKKSGKAMSSSNIEKILLALPNLNPNWLLTGRGSMEYIEDNPLNSESLTTDPTVGFNYVPPTAPADEPGIPQFPSPKQHDRPFDHLINPEKEPKRLPLVSVKAVGGFAGKDFSIQEKDIESYYVIPKFRNLDVDFLIEVIGDSMMPRLFPGDIIACSVIRNPNFIQWNKTYLIATDEQGMIVKRLKKSHEKDCLLAVSDNVDYDPFDIPVADIKGLARVVGVIHAD